MTDIASLIERLLHPMWQYHNDGSKRLAQEETLADLTEAASELSRLTVSPLPDEIAELIERLEQRPCTPLAELREEAAAAIRAQAQEVASLKREIDWHVERIAELEEEAKNQANELAAVLRRSSARIAELEGEVLQYKGKAEGAPIVTEALSERIAELEEERDEWKDAAEHATSLHAMSIAAAQAAIRAKTMADCAAIADRYAAETPDDSLRQGAKWIAEDIRALSQEAGE